VPDVAGPLRHGHLSVGEGAAQVACAEGCARAILHLEQHGSNRAA
jgi:hypothetical protein